MFRRISLLASVATVLAGPALAQDLTQAPPGGDYQKVSNLVELPEFVSGLGVLRAA